jgi:hypothetical protein
LCNPLLLKSIAIRRRLCFLFSCIVWITASAQQNSADTTPLSIQQQALSFLANETDLVQSAHWPSVNPVVFMQNLKKNIEIPLSIYEGRSTNFCAYAALSYLPLHDDPLTYVKFMGQLYKEGKATYGTEYFDPSPEVKQAAGTLSFKGELDIRPADQLWFLGLADHFKGYLNILDKHFNMGDENKMWAAVNFAKFNRMIRKLFNYDVSPVGSDLFRPGIRDIFKWLSGRMATGHIALFVNNLSLYRKNHTRIKVSVPTHYVILLEIAEVDDKIAITYWDYGGKSRQLLKPDFLKKLIFGIAHITQKTGNAK